MLGQAVLGRVVPRRAVLERARVVVLLLVALTGLSGCLVTGSSTGPVVARSPWRLVQSSPSASSVLVVYYHGACDSLVGGSATPITTSVAITVLSKYRGGTCGAVAVRTLVRVRLGAELGRRAIYGCTPHPGRPVRCLPIRMVLPVRTNIPVIGP